MQAQAAEAPEAVTQAIMAFQASHGLDVTGALDDATHDALKQAHRT